MLDRVTHRAQSAAFERKRTPTTITRPALGARPIETGGWDVVSAVRIREINEAIENAGTSPERFEDVTDDGITVRGRFSPWRIGPDGDGALIDLDIGLREVEIERKGEVTCIKDAMAIVRVFLELLPTGKNSMLGAAPTEEFALVLKTGVDPNRLMVDKEATPATVMEIEAPKDVSPRDLVYLKIAMQHWMNDNLDQFHHVFATVNLVRITAEEAKDKAFSWMMPNEVGYAFARSNAAPENSVLAILCQTGGRTSEGLIHQAQADIIPPGANGAFAISKRRLIREMMLPGVASSFEGLKKTDFRYRKEDGGLALIEPVQLKSFEEGDKTYDPVLHKLDIVLRDTEIAIESKTKVEIDRGIRSVCQSVARYTFGMTENSEGEKTLEYKELQAPDPSHEIERDKARDITDLIRRIAGAIAGVVMLMAGPVGAAIALGVAIGCLVGEWRQHDIEKYQSEDSPPIDLLVANATTAVSWSTGTRFDPIFAALNGGLQVGGILGAPKSESLMSVHRDFQAPHRKMMTLRASAPRGSS